MSRLQVHRCHWCGKEIVKSPTSIETVNDITILCSGCLDWELKDGNVLVTKMLIKTILDTSKNRKFCLYMEEEEVK